MVNNPTNITLTSLNTKKTKKYHVGNLGLEQTSKYGEVK
jgi:hypothetical protein